MVEGGGRRRGRERGGERRRGRRGEGEKERGGKMEIMSMITGVVPEGVI